MKKKFLSVVCAVVLSISLTSCSLADTLGKLSGNAATWVDSDLIGAIPEDKEIRVQDDFAAAVNQEWKKETGDNYRNYYTCIYTEGILGCQSHLYGVSLFIPQIYGRLYM